MCMVVVDLPLPPFSLPMTTTWAHFDLDPVSGFFFLPKPNMALSRLNPNRSIMEHTTAKRLRSVSADQYVDA